jgi:hypothetical protein
MAKTQRTYVTYITDPMILVYPKFETPDVYVDPKTKKAGAPCYKTDAKAVDEASMLKVQAFVLAELVKLFPDMDPKTRKRTLSNGDTKTVFWPFKTDKEGNVTLSAKTGRTTKAGELMRVPLFGANNQKLPDSIYPGGGTVARLDLTLNAMPNDGGINFYINAVQVLKLEESSFGKSNFEPTEGYVYDGAEEPKEAQSNFGGEETADEADATKF